MTSLLKYRIPFRDKNNANHKNNHLKFLFMKKLLLYCLFFQIIVPVIAQNKITTVKSSAINGLLVKTANGMVEGTLAKRGIRSFKGIPFAAPPC
jgi:para-nitrobenzyl esterase